MTRFFLIAGCLVVGAWAAHARDIGQWAQVREAESAEHGYAAPDLGEYYRSLTQPDAPFSSCCGESDAYYADQVEECRPSDGDDCVLVAVITDDRDDAIRGRPHREIGTRIPVPRNKIRKRPVPNPTEHNIIFVGSGGRVLCWEPVGGI